MGGLDNRAAVSANGIPALLIRNNEKNVRSGHFDLPFPFDWIWKFIVKYASLSLRSQIAAFVIQKMGIYIPERYVLIFLEL